MDSFTFYFWQSFPFSLLCRTTQKGSALSAQVARKQSPQRKERYFLTDKHEKWFTVTVIVTVCVWRKQSGRGTQHIQHLLFTCRLWITIVPQLSPPQTKASRLRAMEKDYHLECFKSVVKILKFGSNWPNWPTAGQIDAKPAPTARWWCWCKQSEQIKRHKMTFVFQIKRDDKSKLMLEGALTALWCWSRVWRERSAGRSSPSFSATSNSQRWYYEDGELNHLLIKDQIFCQNWGWSRYGQLTCRQLWLKFFWTHCTFSPHYTSLLPQVLYKKTNCSRELKNKCISSGAHFAVLCWYQCFHYY